MLPANATSSIPSSATSGSCAAVGLVEAELWNHYFKSTDVTTPGRRWDVIKREFMLAQGFIGIGANLERLQRRISAVERSTARARAELIQVRA